MSTAANTIAFTISAGQFLIDRMTSDLVGADWMHRPAPRPTAPPGSSATSCFPIVACYHNWAQMIFRLSPMDLKSASPATKARPRPATSATLRF